VIVVPEIGKAHALGGSPSELANRSRYISPPLLVHDDVGRQYQLRVAQSPSNERPLDFWDIATFVEMIRGLRPRLVVDISGSFLRGPDGEVIVSASSSKSGPKDHIKLLVTEESDEVRPRTVILEGVAFSDIDFVNEITHNRIPVVILRSGYDDANIQAARRLLDGDAFELRNFMVASSSSRDAALLVQRKAQSLPGGPKLWKEVLRVLPSRPNWDREDPFFALVYELLMVVSCDGKSTAVTSSLWEQVVSKVLQPKPFVKMILAKMAFEEGRHNDALSQLTDHIDAFTAHPTPRLALFRYSDALRQGRATPVAEAIEATQMLSDFEMSGAEATAFSFHVSFHCDPYHVRLANLVSRLYLSHAQQDGNIEIPTKLAQMILVSDVDIIYKDRVVRHLLTLANRDLSLAWILFHQLESILDYPSATDEHISGIVSGLIERFPTEPAVDIMVADLLNEAAARRMPLALRLVEMVIALQTPHINESIESVLHDALTQGMRVQIFEIARRVANIHGVRPLLLVVGVAIGLTPTETQVRLSLIQLIADLQRTTNRKNVKKRADAILFSTLVLIAIDDLDGLRAWNKKWKNQKKHPFDTQEISSIINLMWNAILKKDDALILGYAHLASYLAGEKGRPSANTVLDDSLLKFLAVHLGHQAIDGRMVTRRLYMSLEKDFYRDSAAIDKTHGDVWRLVQEGLDEQNFYPSSPFYRCMSSFGLPLDNVREAFHNNLCERFQNAIRIIEDLDSRVQQGKYYPEGPSMLDSLAANPEFSDYDVTWDIILRSSRVQPERPYLNGVGSLIFERFGTWREHNTFSKIWGIIAQVLSVKKGPDPEVLLAILTASLPLSRSDVLMPGVPKRRRSALQNLRISLVHHMMELLKAKGYAPESIAKIVKGL
jgi:hypothetical protein